MSVPVSVHQPLPGSTLAVSLDSAPDLSCTNSTQDYCVDVDHQPTDLAVGGSNPSRRAPSPPSHAHTALAGSLDAGRAIWSGGAGSAGWPARPPAAPPRPGSSR